MTNLMYCSKCRKSYPVMDLKYNLSGSLVCKACRKEKDADEDIFKNDKHKHDSIKVKYLCRRCNHAFNLKPNFKQMCPFCGSNQIFNNEFGKDAQSLVEESSDKSYDF